MSLALILQGLYHLRINSPVVLLCTGLRWFAVMITTQRTREIEPRLFIRVNVLRNFGGNIQAHLEVIERNATRQFSMGAT